MRPQGHLKLLVAATVAWFVFWLAGWPDYYRQYSDRTMLVVDALVLPAFVALGVLFARGARRCSPMAASLWLAFYAVVPPFLYDLGYCGVYLGHGLGFLLTYWYLTAYYVIPWALFPLCARFVERERADRRAAGDASTP